MKSIQFSLVAVLLILKMGAMAQEGGSSKFYVKAYGGYGLLTPGSYRLIAHNTTDANPFSILSVSKKSLGAGIRAGAGIGVIASDFLNIGVDVEYLSGAPLTIQSEYRSGSYFYDWNVELKYSSLAVIPHVVFKALSKPDYLIYNKVGILLNLPFEIDKISTDTSSNTSVPYYGKTVETGSYKIKLAAGLNVALGIQVKLNEKLRAFGEVFGNYLILSPESYTATEIETGNNGGATSINNRSITHNYIKEGEMPYSSTSVANDKGGFDSVEKYTFSVSQNRFNMHSIGINIGVTYRF